MPDITFSETDEDSDPLATEIYKLILRYHAAQTEDGSDFIAVDGTGAILSLLGVLSFWMAANPQIVDGEDIFLAVGQLGGVLVDLIKDQKKQQETNEFRENVTVMVREETVQ